MKNNTPAENPLDKNSPKKILREYRRRDKAKRIKKGNCIKRRRSSVLFPIDRDNVLINLRPRCDDRSERRWPASLGDQPRNYSNLLSSILSRGVCWAWKAEKIVFAKESSLCKWEREIYLTKFARISFHCNGKNVGEAPRCRVDGLRAIMGERYECIRILHASIDASARNSMSKEL